MKREKQHIFILFISGLCKTGDSKTNNESIGFKIY